MIVVDDGSVDRTVDVVFGFMDKYPRSNIKVLKLGENKGKGGALVAGVQRCQGKYILMVSNLLSVCLKLPSF